jgi:hypothetical protein
MGNACTTEERADQDAEFLTFNAPGEEQSRPMVSGQVVTEEHRLMKSSAPTQNKSDQGLAAFVAARQSNYLEKPVAINDELEMNPVARKQVNDKLPDFNSDTKPGQTAASIQLNKPVSRYSDESTYMGDINTDGHRHGFGKSVTIKGDLYIGDWVNNKPQGNGRFVRSNGDYYQGQFINGIPHGYGVSSEGKSNIKYEGTWENGNKTGTGVETCPDGSYYKGKFFNPNSGKSNFLR